MLCSHSICGAALWDVAALYGTQTGPGFTEGRDSCAMPPTMAWGFELVIIRLQGRHSKPLFLCAQSKCRFVHVPPPPMLLHSHALESNLVLQAGHSLLSGSSAPFSPGNQLIYISKDLLLWPLHIQWIPAIWGLMRWLCAILRWFIREQNMVSVSFYGSTNGSILPKRFCTFPILAWLMSSFAFPYQL